MSSQFYSGGRPRHSPQTHIAAPSDSSISSQSNWTCSLCTYAENSGDKKRCDLCMTPRPDTKSKSKSKPKSNSNSHKRQRSHHRQHSHHRQLSNGSNTKKTVEFIQKAMYESPRSNGPNPHHLNDPFFETKIGRNPRKSIVPEDITFNPKKPISKQSIFDRWMIAQMERQNGQQPAICVENNVILTNLRRVRAATTMQTIQQRINENTDVMHQLDNLEAGDFTDDEEDELDIMTPCSPSFSQSMNTEDDYNGSKTFSSYVNGKKDEPNSSPLPSIPQSHDIDDYDLNNGQNGYNMHHPDPSDSYNQSGSDFTYNHKKMLNGRRRAKTKRKTKTISQLWFRAQSQLQQGRNPAILAKYNITLTNIRQHNPRFQEYERRRSHHEKAATYLQATGQKLRQTMVTVAEREGVDNDDDEDVYSDGDDEFGPMSITSTAAVSGSYMVADQFID